MPHFAPLLVLSYLIGSIPTAYWLGKLVYGMDIREHGSGNSGATNSMRVLGKKAGFFVLTIDILKGAGTVLLARYLGFTEENVLLLALGAIIGHILPVFARFRGGKGIATAAGVILAFNPLGALLCVAVFLAVVISTKYVSLGSLLGSFSFLLFSFWAYAENPLVQIVCVFLFGLLCYTHRSNIRRLVQGNENKFPPKKT